MVKESKKRAVAAASPNAAQAVQPGFDNIYNRGMARAALCSPPVHLGDPAKNLEETLRYWRRAEEDRAALCVFPELNLSGYSLQDLVLDEALLDAVDDAIEALVEASRTIKPLLIVGAPLRRSGCVTNAALHIAQGGLVMITPKHVLPNYREFYEQRHFGDPSNERSFEWQVPWRGYVVSGREAFLAEDQGRYSAASEVCEDLWAPVQPSIRAALSGAEIICNLSASNATIGKARDRAALCDAQSRRLACAYLFCAAGPGESTTDLAWDGQVEAWEMGELLGRTERFPAEGAYLLADIDIERIRAERRRTPSFREGARDDLWGGFERLAPRMLQELGYHEDAAIPTVRAIARFPYVPDDPDKLHEDCEEAYQIQVQGLAQRMRAARIDKAVIGVSGGLDSTHALTVIARAMDRLGLPRENIIAATLPGFATSEHTKANAHKLMEAFGATALEIDIRPAAEQMLKDIGHPYAAGEARYDTTFENVQAGLRTDYLFKLANHHGGLVVGTGDLSELALGWCTYGVGDHMSHYNVNASAPKTLIQQLIRHVAGSGRFDAATSDLLRAVLATEISPELIPAGESGAIQSTQAVIGPYELHDFFLYYVTRYGLKPSKIAWLAWSAWRDKDAGRWPEGIEEADRREYDLAAIAHWLEVFLRRFFANQFKRSALPDGPKITSGGSLSPRGDWRMPSDASPEAWLKELREALAASGGR